VGFGLLLDPNRFDTVPVAGKLGISSLIHVNFRGAAQAGQRDHDTTDFLLGISLGPAKHVMDQGDCVIPAAAVGLGQFQGFLQKAVGAFYSVRPYRRWEAGFEPFLDLLLIRCNAQSHSLTSGPPTRRYTAQDAHKHLVAIYKVIGADGLRPPA